MKRVYYDAKGKWWVFSFERFSEIIGFLNKELRRKVWTPEEMEKHQRSAFGTIYPNDKEIDYDLVFEQVQDKNGRWIPKNGTIAKSVFLCMEDGNQLSLEHCFYKNGKARDELFNNMYGISHFVGFETDGIDTKQDLVVRSTENHPEGVLTPLGF